MTIFFARHGLLAVEFCLKLRSSHIFILFYFICCGFFSLHLPFITYFLKKILNISQSFNDFLHILNQSLDYALNEKKERLPKKTHEALQ